MSIDTLRADHMPIHGYSRDTTPNLAALAKDSVLFEQAYAAHTTTAPSHASMLTSLYPLAHGIRRNGMKIGDDVVLLPEVLRQHGYTSAAFVSGYTLHRHIGIQRGFDHYDDEFEHERVASETYDRARQWLRTTIEARKPFFLFLHLFDPHYPYEPPRHYPMRFLPTGARVNVPHRFPPPQWRRIPREEQEILVGRYDGEIAFADEQVGRLLADLGRWGVARETLIVFLSDHGETLFERDWGPDHGGRVYDEQIHVPLMFRFPGHPARRGRRIGEQVHHVDVMPTILDWLGLDAPPGASGLSLMPLVEGTGRWPDPRPVFSHAQSEPERVPRILEKAKLSNQGLVRSIRLPGVKLIEYPMGDGGWYRELFLLASDPHEDDDVADAHRALADDLHAQLERWQTSLTGGIDLPEPEIPAEVRERLRALGYAQ